MQLYKVKLNDPEASQPNTHSNGYLASEGELALYKRGEALKKAILFAGKIEKHGKNYTATEVKVLQLSRKEISTDVIRQLEDRELMRDTDGGLNECTYYGDVFDAILGEDKEKMNLMRMSEATAEEIYTLRELTWQYQYLMIVN